MKAFLRSYGIPQLTFNVQVGEGLSRDGRTLVLRLASALLVSLRRIRRPKGTLLARAA